MLENGIVINGAFGKFLAAVVILLLGAGVIGIWQMNGTLNRLVVQVQWMKAEQVNMRDDVDDNTSGIDRMTGPRTAF